MPNLSAYHISRVLATVIFVPAIFLFGGRFLRSTAERMTATVVIFNSARLVRFGEEMHVEATEKTAAMPGNVEAVAAT